MALSSEDVRQRLHLLKEDDLVSWKELGARAVNRWAEVAPELSNEATERVDCRATSEEWIDLQSPK